MTKHLPVIDALEQFLAYRFIHPIHGNFYPCAKFARFVVALSGGKDSICLLDALTQLLEPSKIQAVYVDHGLQSEAKNWSQFNQNFCHRLGVAYQSIEVTVDTHKASIEQEARIARYQAFEPLIDENSCLLTAQHLNDQAETFLLQLFRGAGSKGLSAMPYIKPFANGFHARPLLNVSQAGIERYIAERQLDYIEDPSNQDVNIRRNYLRHQVMPVLKEQWDNLDRILANAADLQAVNESLLFEVAKDDLARAKDPVYGDKSLLIANLLTLSKARLNNLLRYWLDLNGLKMPNRKLLDEIAEQFLFAATDANPLIEYQDFQLRRYRNNLYLVAQESLVPISKDRQWVWLLQDDFKINEQVAICLAEVLFLYPELKGQQVEVRLRQGGEKCTLPNRAHRISVKKYLQEKGVPPWLREQTLLVWHQGQVIFIQEKKL